jgi:uncharacterized membrane protein YfcA
MELMLAAGVAAAAGLAGFTQGLAGFGSTLVALPLLGAVLPARAATPLGCLMALGINACLIARLRGRVAGRDLSLLLAASLPGMAVGAWMLGDAPEALLKGLLGGYLVWCGARGYRAASRPPPAPARGRLAGGAATGLLAGFLGVAIGVNGPPVVAWASRRIVCRDALRATLAGYFLAAGTGIVGAQWARGLVTSQVLWLFALSLPALAVGLAGGTVLCGRISEPGFRRVVFGLLTAAGLGLVWQAFDKAGMGLG